MRVRIAALAVVMLLAGCGSDTPTGQSSEKPTGQSSEKPTEQKGLTVLAAASLTETFTKIGKDFEAAQGTTVTFSFGGSSGLATQITNGAPADVFAAASPATMKTVTDAGDAAGEPAVFVRNQLVIAVPKGNPKGLTSLAALEKPGIKVALCAEQVPCGAAAKKAGVKVKPVTLEQDVKAALSKVKLGEVDAALVYRTDAEASASDVDGVEFPESASAVNDYPIVTLNGREESKAFVAYVQSEPAQKVLADAGFQRP